MGLHHIALLRLTTPSAIFPGSTGAIMTLHIIPSPLIICTGKILNGIVNLLRYSVKFGNEQRTSLLWIARHRLLFADIKAKSNITIHPKHHISRLLAQGVLKISNILLNAFFQKKLNGGYISFFPETMIQISAFLGLFPFLWQLMQIIGVNALIIVHYCIYSCSSYTGLRPDQHEWQFSNPLSAVARKNYRPGMIRILYSTFAEYVL